MAELEPGAHDRRPVQGSAVPLARSEDIARRRRVYTIQMAVRMACFLALPFLPGWWKALALAGAVVLPYVAVLMANDPALDGQAETRIDEPAIDPTRRLEAHPAAQAGSAVIRVDADGSIHDVGEDDSPQERSGPEEGSGDAARTAASESWPTDPATHDGTGGGTA